MRPVEPGAPRIIATGDPCDVMIIGGGALGSAMAWEAASRGLRTSLVERDDFGCATSANSLRIVHGGLRYLQKMDFRRARRSAGERSALLRIAPHLIEPLRCVIPALPSLARGRAALAAGLMLNNLVTLDRNRGIEPERRLPAGGLLGLERFRALAPGIPTSGWSGAACWYDASMIDSERLCLEFVISARSKGAMVFNHAEATSLRRAKRGGSSVTVRDRLSGTTTEIRTQLVIDCRGVSAPRAGDAARSSDLGLPDCEAVKAVNIVLDAPPTACAVGFPTRDASGRTVAGPLFYALPYHGALAVGTWYFPVEPRAFETAESSLTQDELHKILGDLAANTDWNLTAEQIVCVHAGLLPRSADHADPVPIDRPRIYREPDNEQRSGLWRVRTEKWTTVRGLAEKAIDTIVRREGLSAASSATRFTPLCGADFSSLSSLRSEARTARPAQVDKPVVERLTTRYGRNALQILREIGASPALAERMPHYPSVTRAEVAYSAREEMTYTLADLTLRRLGLGAAGCPPAESLAFAAEVLGQHHGWSDAERALNVEAVQRYRAFHVV